MSPEAMMAVSRFMISSSYGHQQTPCTKYLKELISSHVQLLIGLAVQQMMQLAGAQSGLSKSYVSNKVDDSLLPGFSRLLRFFGLIPSLATDT